jgi:hypothetical protein
MSSFVFHRDHHATKDKQHVLKERVQLSGLCYIHAPVILQHYLVSMHPEVSQAPTLDIPAYLRKHMHTQDLYNHIWYDSGGNSLNFLLKILHEKPRDGVKSYPFGMLTEFEDILIARLKEFGPALVSNFKVHNSFTNTCGPYLGSVTGVHLGNHSMVLIGVRTHGDGSHHFLLQNWWVDMPYVEVDIPYLVSCSADFHFITVPQQQIGIFDGSMADYAENVEGIDCAEQYTREGGLN